jgi:hypothetical protein
MWLSHETLHQLIQSCKKKKVTGQDDYGRIMGKVHQREIQFTIPPFMVQK